MVFESLVADILNRTLGVYIENLDRKQLKIGIWGGDVVLHNLKVRENALDDLDLPVKLMHGHLGKLVLKIPWKNLYSQPVVAQIEDLYVLIAPRSMIKYDAGKEEYNELMSKRNALKAIDEARLKELEIDKVKTDPGLQEKLTARIVNNVQVKISNVHLRYEDTTTAAIPFAFGITLHNLEVYTTNEEWEKCYISEHVSRVFKLAILDSFSIYMNCHAHTFSTESLKGIIDLFRNNIATKEYIPPKYNFVMGPISATTRLSLNLNPAVDEPPFVIPKIHLYLQIEKLNVYITNVQYQNILSLLEAFNSMQLAAPYRKFRPFSIPYAGHSKEWWKFAITCVLHDVRQRLQSWDWKYIQEHRRVCKSYAEAYKELSLSKKPPASLKEMCNLAESKLDLFNLIIIRKRVQMEIERIEQEEAIKKEEQKGSWFGGWFAYCPNRKDPDNIRSQFEAAMSKEEKAKLYDAIGYQENTAPLELPEHYEALFMQFELAALEVGLFEDSSQTNGNPEGMLLNMDQLNPILLLSLSSTTCTVKQRPAANAINVMCGMKKLHLFGYKVRDSTTPVIIESKTSQESNLFDILYETHPIDCKCDQRLRVLAHPLQIVYDSNTVLQLLKLFMPKQKVNLSEVEGAASLKIANFQERSASGLQYMIDSHAILEIDIKLMPNIIIIPYQGCYKANKVPILVISLGQLQILSEPHKLASQNLHQMHETGMEYEQIIRKMMTKAYDKYKLTIDDVQLLMARPNEDWENIVTKGYHANMHILRPTTFIIDAELCVVDNDPRLPKIKIDILLPAINLNLNEDRVMEAVNVALSIPRPQNAPTEIEPPSSLRRSLSVASSMRSRSLPVFQQSDLRKSMASSAAIEEVVQHTNLQLTFTLKTFSVALLRPEIASKTTTINEVSSSTNTTVYHTPDDNASEEYLPNMYTDVHNSIFINPDDSNRVLALQISELHMFLAQRTFELATNAKLGAISLLFYEKEKNTELAIIETPSYKNNSQPLLNIDFILVDKTTPDFTTKYKSVEQFLKVNFTTLNVILHQENILRILEIATRLQNELENIKNTKEYYRLSRLPAAATIASAGADDGLMGRLASIAEESARMSFQQTNRKKRHLRKVVESIKMRIEANLDEVAVELTCRKRSLAMIKINSLFAGVVLKTAYTEVEVGLKNIVIIDRNSLTRHSDFLSIIGQDALNCKLVFYNLEETRNYNDNDIHIDLTVGCVKVIFVNWFVTSVASFMNNFQAAKTAIANAGAKAADVAKNNVLDMEKVTRMKLNIKIKAPVICIPIDSQSSDAIVIDMGQLLITNSLIDYEVLGDNEEHGPVVIDDMKLILKDMRIMQVKLSPLSPSRGGVGKIVQIQTTNSIFDSKSERNILDNSNFSLSFKRNLSFVWHKDIPEFNISGCLQTIELNILMDDYGLMMSILNRNLKEGKYEFPQIKVAEEEIPKSKLLTSGEHGTIIGKALERFKDPLELKLRKKRIQEQYRYNLKIDGIVVNFMTSANEGLARFGLYLMSLKGSKLMDETMTISMILCNIQLDDIRPSKKSQITKYLCRKDWLVETQSSTNDLINDDVLAHCDHEKKYMVDFTLVTKGKETVMNVRVSSFDLILCVEFMMKITEFLKIPDVAEPILPERRKSTITIRSTLYDIEENQQQNDIIASKQAAPKPLHSVVNQLKNAETEVEESFKIDAVIDEPNIILVETLEDMNTSAIIFNMHAELNYRAVNERQVINGVIDGLKMYMCSFLPERREATRHYILHPCLIALHGSTPEEKGMHVSLKFTDIIINISPATLELINKAIKSVSGSNIDQHFKDDHNNYQDIWKSKEYNLKQHWFIRVDESEDALDYIDSSVEVKEAPKTESCIIELPSVALVLEAGIGYYTTPLISVDTTLNAAVHNWSSGLSVNGYLSLIMNYYNSNLAVWEPVIEQNEHIDKLGAQSYEPWVLNFNLKIEPMQTELDAFKRSRSQNTQLVNIKSEENLEVTISKTFLELLQSLGDAFSQAMDPSGLVKPDVIAPYVLENDTGFDLTVDLTASIFMVHECYTLPDVVKKFNLNRYLEFKLKAINQNKLGSITSASVQSCVVAPFGKLYLQTKELASISCPEEEEYTVHVTVGDIGKKLILPVSKSDKRYFSLYRDTNYDPWGIVSEVNSEYGTTIINIHGILTINNHFTIPIKIYRVKPRNHDFILVGTAQPEKVFHMPLHAIYSELKFLYFSIEDYNISVQGIKWDDSPSDLQYQRQVQCDPINSFEPFYININRQKTEIYHENTNKFKLLSVYYTLHLRPPIYLRNALPIDITVSVSGCLARDSANDDEDANENDNENSKESIIKYNVLNSPDKKKENEETTLVMGSTNDLVDSDKPPFSTSSTFVKEDLLDFGEKVVEPGNVLHLPTMKLATQKGDCKRYLVVRLIQYLEKYWSCTMEITEEHQEFASWRFNSYDSEEKMSIDLCIKYGDRYGSMELTIFSPFWLINKTGQMLSYKTDTENLAVLYHPPEYTGPILFAFREKYLFNKKNCSIRVESGEWSKKIPLDIAGSTGSVSCKYKDITYQIAVHNHLTSNSLTKLITFIPFYVVINKCNFNVYLQEYARPGDAWKKVTSESCVALWPKTSDQTLVARVSGQRTMPFKYCEPTVTLLQLNNNIYGGMNVEVQMTEGGVYITFTEYRVGDAPGLLINHTSHPIKYYEKNVETAQILKPNFEILYAWKNPAAEKLLVFGENNVENDLRSDGAGELILPNEQKGYWVSFLDGLQRVLLFTEYEDVVTKSSSTTGLDTITNSIEVKIHGIGLSVLNNDKRIDILYLGITSSGIIWESKKENKNRYKEVNLHDTSLIEGKYQEYIIDKAVNKAQEYYVLDDKQKVNFTEMLFYKANSKREIKRTCLPGVWLSLNTSPHQTQIHLKINRIQMDNQLYDCVFPVVLAPIPPPKTLARTTHFKPFIECSIIQKVVPNSNVNQFKYASLLIQEFHFKVDLIFLTALAELFASTPDDDQDAKIFKQDVESVEKPLEHLLQNNSHVEQKHFYDHLHLGPMKVHLSFSMAGIQPSALPGVLSNVVQGVGVTLTDVNDVVIRLAYFEREFLFFTQQQLVSEISSHYIGQAIKQFYVLVLGLDVLGNPYGLVVGIKRGVEDMFYEPFQGAIQGPGEFAEGLVIGFKSLLGHTVGGAAGAISKISGAMGKGLAVLTFDDDYQRKRRQIMHSKPKTFQAGIARSGKGLVMGFVDGVTGVVTKPISGAREEGVEGFFKGLGKGTIGLVTRPTAGIVDFAHGTFDGVKRVAESNAEEKRLRPPRYQRDDKVLRPYCLDDAKGNQMLRELDKGKYYNTDTFVYCIEVIKKQEFFLVTNHRILYLTRNDVFGNWAIQWTYLYNEIGRLASTDRGVEIYLIKDQRKVLGLFTSNEPQNKLILVPEKYRREKVIQAIESNRTASE